MQSCKEKTFCSLPKASRTFINLPQLKMHRCAEHGSTVQCLLSASSSLEQTHFDWKSVRMGLLDMGRRANHTKPSTSQKYLDFPFGWSLGFLRHAESEYHVPLLLGWVKIYKYSANIPQWYSPFIAKLGVAAALIRIVVSMKCRQPGSHSLAVCKGSWYADSDAPLWLLIWQNHF